MPEPTFINDRYVRTAAMLAMIRRVLWRMLLATAAVAVLGSVIGYLIAGMPGIWATLLAAGIGLFFTGTTVALIYLVVGRGPELLQIVLLGGWIVKMGVVFVLLLWLRQLDFYHRGVFVGAIMVLALALVMVELVTVVTARIPYVDPSMRPQEDPEPVSAVDSEAEADPETDDEATVEPEQPDPPAGGHDGGSDRVG